MADDDATMTDRVAEECFPASSRTEDAELDVPSREKQNHGSGLQTALSDQDGIIDEELATCSKKRKMDDRIIVERRPWVQAASLGLEEAGRFIADRSHMAAKFVSAKVAELQHGPDRLANREPNDWSVIMERFSTLSWYERELVAPVAVGPGGRPPATAAAPPAAAAAARAEGAIAGFLAEYEARALQVARLKRRARRGRDDAQYHLAALFAPPPFQERGACVGCGRRFGLARYRHHCRHCGESFCHPCSHWRRACPNLGFREAVRVCRACCALLSREARADRVAWRLQRARAALGGALRPYFECRVDTALHAAARVMEGALAVAKASPLSMGAYLTVETLDLLRRYGLIGVAGILMRQEFLQAVELLCKVSGMERRLHLSLHEITAAMFYQLAHSRGARGNDPDGEWRAHEGMAPVPDAELDEILFFAPLPLFFMYDKDPVETQLLASHQGWKLVCLSLDSAPEQPAFGIFLHSERNVVALVVRGTHTIQDVVTDIRARPIPFGDVRPDTAQLGGRPRRDPRSGREIGGDWGLGEEALEKGGKQLFEGLAASSGGAKGDGEAEGSSRGMAMCGIARAAEWLYCEVYHTLRAFRAAGAEVVLLGHSLGAAVASMAAELLWADLAGGDGGPGLRCLAFATPACATRPLARAARRHTTSVVLHDDVIPRITPSSVRALVQALTRDRQRFHQDLHRDAADHLRRAKTVWAPRRRFRPRGCAARGAPAATEEPNSKKEKRISNDGEEALGQGNEILLDEKGDSEQEEVNDLFSALQKSTERKGGAADSTKMMNEEEHGEVIEGSTYFSASEEENNSDEAMLPGYESWVADQLRARKHGREDLSGKQSKCIVGIHNEREIINMADDGSISNSSLSKNIHELGGQPGVIDLTMPSPEAPNKTEINQPKDEDSPHSTSPEGEWQKIDDKEEGKKEEEDHPASDWQKVEKCDAEDSDDDMGILVDEVILPEQYIPGKVIHIYSHKGLYRACYVPQNFPDLRKITMVGNMVEDHGSGKYFSALFEVRDVRAAREAPPAWVPFDATDRCQVCAAEFTWASTSSSDAQANRDKHNCKRCGSLVCDPCSKTKRSLPKFGLHDPARICDKCYFSGLV